MAESARRRSIARRSATDRTYRYLVWNGPWPDPLLAPITWHVRDELDLRAMRSASDVVLGTHDFRSFCRRKPGTAAEEPILRRVIRAAWSEEHDSEVRRLIDEGYETAKRILTEKYEDLDRLAKGLLEYETLTGSEITRVIAGEPLNRGDDRNDTPPQGPGASVTAIPKTARPRPPRAEPEPEPTA